jgi:hypothetical protein
MVFLGVADISPQCQNLNYMTLYYINILMPLTDETQLIGLYLVNAHR